MALRRQMQHGVGPEALQDVVDRLAVADIDLEMRVAVAVARLGQQFEIAGVGQLVDVGDGPIGVADDVADHGRADEARAAGDQDFHGVVLGGLSPSRSRPLYRQLSK